MSQKSDIRAEAERLRALFEAQGAEVFETDILQPAGALLDLYGEDIRARAFVTHDPLRGEMMLRPDFTVPLVQRHMAEGRGQARYAYVGEVFRRQENGDDRASEYLQAGFEIFNGSERAEADAEVFATFHVALAPLRLRAAMGDIGLLRAAVEGLDTTPARKAALLHHMWRPRRFRRLLERFSLAADPPQPVSETTGAAIGLRSASDVSARLAALKEDAAAAPISAESVAMLEALLAVRGSAPDALLQVRNIAAEMTSISCAVDMLARRFDALDARGVSVDALTFEASYGRTTLEYYDGFVFGFYADNRPDLPPVATGGRYDALTRAIGGGDGIPAVGGAIRPHLTLSLVEGA